MALSPVRLRASMSVGSSDTIAFTRSNSPALMASMKAARLDVASGMVGSYRAARPKGLALLLLLTVFSGAAFAQAPAPQSDPPARTSQERPPLGAWFTVDAFGALPT